MSDSVYIGRRANNINVSPQFDAYSKVIINIDDETQVVSGNDTGRTLEITNPFGNQQMADDILARLRGFKYQPYNAKGTLLNPAAEIGDAAETATSYGGIYTRSREFKDLMKADISAPHDEEIDSEYKYESPSERKFKREVGDVRASIILTNNMIQQEVADRQNAENVMTTRISETASAVEIEATRATQAEGNISAALSVQASEIAAKVNASGGSSSSFGWVLNTAGHTWYAGSREVMKVTASGLTVNGVVNATGGTIGGFTIGANDLSYNGLVWGDTTKNYGAYIGRNGIQLGKNFSVDNSGKVKASSLALKGTITFLNDDGSTAGTMSASSLKTGASQAYSNYSKWNGTSTNVGNNSSYWSGGAAGGFAFDAATTSISGAVNHFFAKSMTVSNVASIGTAVVNGITWGNYTLRRKTKAVKDSSGNTIYIHYIAWMDD